MHHPVRPGIRGGRDQFKWEDVKADKFRENFLGHSVMAPVGRWQKGKDLTWYAKDKKSTGEREDELRSERERMKEDEEDAMNQLLGLAPKRRKSVASGSGSQRLESREMQQLFERGHSGEAISEVYKEGERIQGVGFSQAPGHEDRVARMRKQLEEQVAARERGERGEGGGGGEEAQGKEADAEEGGEGKRGGDEEEQRGEEERKRHDSSTDEESGSDEDALHKRGDGGREVREKEKTAKKKKKEGKGEGERVSVKRQRREAKEERRARKKARREEKRRKADDAERVLARRGVAEEGDKGNAPGRDGEERHHDKKSERLSERPDERRVDSKGRSFEDMFRAGALGVGSESTRKKRERAQEHETRKMDRREYKKMQKEESKSWRGDRDD